MEYVYDVLTVGNVMIDAFMTIENGSDHCRIDTKTNEMCFGFGEKINVTRCDFCLGGNAANVAVGLKRLGVKATLCAEIGDDELSIKVTNILAQENIDRICIHQDKDKPTSFSVVINMKGDRTIFAEHIHRKHHFNFSLLRPKWVYLTSLGNEWVYAYETAYDHIKKHNTLLAFNPGSMQFEEWNTHKTLLEKILAKTEILFVNKEEAEEIALGHEVKSAEADVKELVEKIHKKGVKNVVLTDGKKGSYTSDGNTIYHLGLFPSEIIERTGAGDGYAAGFIAAIVHGKSLQEAMRWGSINASGVIGAIGAEKGLQRKEEMENKLSGNPEFVPHKISL